MEDGEVFDLRDEHPVGRITKYICERFFYFHDFLLAFAGVASETLRYRNHVRCRVIDVHRSETT